MFLLTACASVEKQDPIPTSEYAGKSAAATNAAAATKAPANPTAVDRIELSGDAIPVGTTLEFVLLDPISSAAASVGDIFRLRTRTAVAVNGVEVLPSGLSAHGEVIHADNKGLLGKPGELLLKLRAIDWQGRSIKLRNSVGGVARDRTKTAVVMTQLFGLFGLFVRGNEIEIPIDSIILGDLAEAIAVPANVEAPNPLPTTEAK